MSILIKGMEIPRCCGDGCDFLEPIGLKCLRTHKFLDREDYWHERHKDCPLVEIPESHGDLIDRDAFRADFSMGENCDKCGIELKRCEYDRIYTKMDFCGWLDDAPAVIEAEGSEDDEQIQADH